MGRNYAGILGLLAFSVVLARGLLGGGGVESTLKIACGCLFGFAALGYGIGQLAAWIVRDSVHTKLTLQSRSTETESEKGPAS